MVKLSIKDKKEICRLAKLFPEAVTVRASRSADGGFSAEIITFPNCFTEADTFSELIEMVNDAVYTYFDVPKKLISYMPNYMPPMEVAYHLLGFSVRKGEDLQLVKFPDREAVCN
ncbi:MAG: hypothetical protein HZC14_00695 [Candidatus Niyogibacteria bacterium]|nr:hypothetical protein [Candidatus Niyogibacteria bacterium]